MEQDKEHRQCKVYVRNPGGNASLNAKQYRVNLPPKWMAAMGITQEDRDVRLAFDGEKISIKKIDRS